MKTTLHSKMLRIVLGCPLSAIATASTTIASAQSQVVQARIPESTRHDGTRRRTGRHAQYLDSSDYGLLHEGDFTPPPNFWAAVLWRRLMGTTVLQAEESPSTNLHLYAHCLRGVKGAWLYSPSTQTKRKHRCLPCLTPRNNTCCRPSLFRVIAFG